MTVPSQGPARGPADGPVIVQGAGLHELRMDDETARRVIRYNVRFAWGYAAFFAVMSIPQFVLGNLALGVVQIALALALLPLTVALARRMARVTALTFGNGTYTYRTLWRTTRFRATDVAFATTIVQMALGGGIAGSSHHLVVAGSTRRLLIMVGQMWTIPQLTTIAEDLAARGVPVHVIAEPITPARLRTWDRRTMPWWQAHPVAFALITTLATLVVLIVGFVVLVAWLVEGT